MKRYYQDIVTEKSRQVLFRLKSEIDFTLIGGWAVYLYTQALKSKDIDIIIDYSNLGKLQALFPVNKNARLKKYEIKQEGIDIDIYLPFYSILALPVEEIVKYETRFGGFKTIPKEMLLILKQKAYQERKLSIKGQKDKIDIISLSVISDFNFTLYKQILNKYRLTNYLQSLLDIFTGTKIVQELNFNLHQFSKIKKEILRKIS